MAGHESLLLHLKESHSNCFYLSGKNFNCSKGALVFWEGKQHLDLEMANNVGLNKWITAFYHASLS